MRMITRKIFVCVFISLSLCACNAKEPKDKMQKNYIANVISSTGILSVEDKIEKKKNVVLQHNEEEQVYFLSNKATLFQDYLYINSTYTNLIFSERDEEGNYHIWHSPDEIMTGAMSAYCHFEYNDQLVCVSSIDGENSEIIIYDSSFAIKSRKELESFHPQYISGKLLYGRGNSTKHTIVQTIDLETLDINTIYTSNLKKRLDFIINNNREMIICEHPERNKTIFFKLNDGSLTPIFETKNSVMVFYDDRGLFYLEEYKTDSQWNLMLWDGTDIQMIEEIKTEDVNEWTFANGLSGNIIIEDNFFISIHTLAEEPYLLIHIFDSKEIKRIALEKWPLTEADRERYGETFSGVYYEKGEIIVYFFSKKAGMLQTKTLNVTQ